jgi:hypothetical protein
MGTPTRVRHYRRSSGELEKTELMVGNCANRIRVVPFHSVRLSGTHRLSFSGRWRERSPALIQFPPSPTINSVLSNAGELRHP